MVFKRLIFVLLFFFVLTGWSQENDSIEKSEDDLSYLLESQRWKISVPVWVPGFRGSFAYGGISLYPEQGERNLQDRVTDSNLSIQFYLIGAVEFRYQRLFVELDGFKATLGSNLTFFDKEFLELNGTIEGAILRGVLGFSLYEKKDASRLFKVGVMLYGGVRYYNLHIYTDNRNILDIKPNWAEPIFGLKIPISYKRWNFSARGDVGGVAASATQSWFLHGDVAYRFSKLFSLGAGWTVLDFTHDRNFDFKNLDLAIRLTGPTMNVRFSF